MMVGVMRFWISILVLCGSHSAGAPVDSSSGDPATLRAAIHDLMAEFPGSYPHGRAYLNRLDQVERSWNSTDAAERASADRAFAKLQREALTAHPLVSGRPIVYVVRSQYAPDHHNTGTDFQPGEISAGGFRGGGAIKAIDFSRGGEVQTLWQTDMGVARDLEVHFDAARLLFSMRRDSGDSFHLYEMNADGSGLRQLTHGGPHGDMDPMYLPTGQIVFASTRDPKYCGCNRHIQANLFVMAADGVEIQQIGRNNLYESRSSLMPDGRILYDRWEYVDRHFGPSFGLWTMNPDGTGSALYYGNNAWSPGAIFDARVMPGSQRVAAIFGACHDRPWGALVILDRRHGLDYRKPVVHSWPADLHGFLENPHEFEDGLHDIPPKPSIEHPLVGLIDTFCALPIKYEDPYPLSPTTILCSRMTGQGEQMGIYLVDTFGNEVLLHAEVPGCFDPMPLTPRPRPPVLPSRVDATRATGVYYVADVYRGTGMEAVPRGTVKKIRVIEAPPKRFWSQEHWHIDTHQAPAMNFNCTNNKRILGDAPVEEDGSAYFEVPADRFVFFQALDAEGMMVQSMRSGTTIRPGEQAGCVGCHESRLSGATITYSSASALRRPPSQLKPWYGPPREFSYTSEVQPVFDRHCVQCHDYGQEAEPALNLAGDLGLVFNTSYLDLRNRSPIRWHPDRPNDPKPLIKAVDDGPPEVLPAYAWGSHRSRLVDVLRSSHYDVCLSREDLERIITWIDLNAPYYGSYDTSYPENPFGRSPLTRPELMRLRELTGVPLDAENVGAELRGSQVSFTRPERSLCLQGLEPGNPRYDEALTIIRTGGRRLEQRPRQDHVQTVN